MSGKSFHGFLFVEERDKVVGNVGVVPYQLKVPCPHLGIFVMLKKAYIFKIILKCLN